MTRDLAAALPAAGSRPLTVNESRNLKVVAILIAAMTVGGGLLLWLQPPRPRWGADALLMAERVDEISDLTVELVPSDAANLADYDCVVLPSGECRWQPQGASVRLAVVASGAAQLPDEQARKLLGLLGSLSQSRRLDLGRVRLDSNSDPRVVTELGGEAADLLALLQRKGIVP